MEPERRADAASRSEPWNLVEPERRPAPETRTEPERRSGPQGTGELPGRIEPAIRANPNPEARAPVGDASALPPSPSAARIVIHHYARDAAAAARALALQARLTSLPEVEVEIKPVTMLIAADNIRVFFESDRPKAHRAIERLASGPIPIRNFSDYRPLPRPGTIELWLAATDSSSAAASLPETTPAPTSAPSSAPTSAPTSAPNSGRTSAPASAATSAATSTSASPSRSASAARSRRQEVPPSPSSAPTRSGAETLRLLLLQPDEPKSGNR